MNIHEIAAIDADCLLEDGRGNTKDCRDIWSDCTVIVCENSKGHRRLLTSAAGGACEDIATGDEVRVRHTQTGRISKLGNVVGKLLPNMVMKPEHDKIARRIWTMK